MNKAETNIKFLIRTLVKYDQCLLLIFVLSVIFSALAPFTMILVPKYMLNAIIEEISSKQWVVLLVFITLSSVSIYAITNILNHIFKTHISIARNGCFGKILSDKMFSMRYELLEQPDIQDLCFRANMLFWSDNSGMAGVFDNLKKILANGITLTGLTIILFHLHPFFPFLITLSVLVNLFLYRKVKKKEIGLWPHISKLEREKDYLINRMRNASFGKDIRLFGLSEWLGKWYGKVINNQKENTENIQNQYLKYHIVAATLTMLRETAVYGYLTLVMLNGHIKPDNFVMYLSVVSCFTVSLTDISESVYNIRQFIQQTNDFRKVMEISDEAYSANDDFDKAKSCAINVDHVYYKYPNTDKFAVKDLNFKIKQGEHIAVVGENGAGKSTFVKLLTGLYKPQKGTILIYDENIRLIVADIYYNQFSAVFQKIYQYAFTIEENVAFEDASILSREEVCNALERTGLTEQVNKLTKGLNTLLRKDYDPEGIDLSMGQAQKLALARALYQDKPIIILDEPTSALDPIAERQLYLKFDELFKNKTCIYISHRLNSIMFCDRIVLIEDGSIKDSGSHEEMLATNKKYAEMWNAQSNRYKDGGSSDCER